MYPTAFMIKSEVIENAEWLYSKTNKRKKDLEKIIELEGYGSKKICIQNYINNSTYPSLRDNFNFIDQIKKF